MIGCYPDITPEGLQVALFPLTRDWEGIEEVLGRLQVSSPCVGCLLEVMVGNVPNSGVISGGTQLKGGGHHVDM